MTDDIVRDALYYRLFAEAERARWPMASIPFDAIDRRAVSPGLIAFVRSIALSELTTFSASRKFLAEFADDVDFTQWISVWFYEETRHPQVLMRWLASVGEGVDDATMRRGRLTPPFMKSRVGTLVSNVISEMMASAAYMNLARTSPEPVLAFIGKCLAADEARHGAAFYCYAQRAIECAEDPDDERATALKVLHLWLRDSENVGHPVNQFHERLASDAERDIGGVAYFDRTEPRARVRRMIGVLVGRDIGPSDDVMDHVRAVSRRGSAGSP